MVRTEGNKKHKALKMLNNPRDIDIKALILPKPALSSRFSNFSLN
jgi:hypothetical protein